LRFLRIRVGTWKMLAKVLRFEASTMRNVNKGVNPVSINMAYRASRLAGVPFEDVVTGTVPGSWDVPALREGARTRRLADSWHNSHYARMRV
jgi:hypothetical protein